MNTANTILARLVVSFVWDVIDPIAQRIDRTVTALSNALSDDT